MRIGVKWSSALALGSVLLAAPAMAADDGIFSPDYSWTGFYIGAAAGYGWGETRMNDGFAPLPWSTQPFPVGGALYGLTAGANLQPIGPLVIGIEGDISGANIRGSAIGQLMTINAPGPWNCNAGGQNLCYASIEALATLRGRIGFAVGSALLYGTGGIAFADINAGIAGSADYTGNWWQQGWTAGGGIEIALSSDWTAKAEYLHVDLGWTPPVNAVDFRTNINANIVRVGVNRLFR